MELPMTTTINESAVLNACQKTMELCVHHWWMNGMYRTANIFNFGQGKFRYLPERRKISMNLSPKFLPVKRGGGVAMCESTPSTANDGPVRFGISSWSYQ